MVYVTPNIVQCENPARWHQKRQKKQRIDLLIIEALARQIAQGEDTMTASPATTTVPQQSKKDKATPTRIVLQRFNKGWQIELYTSDRNLGTKVLKGKKKGHKWALKQARELLGE